MKDSSLDYIQLLQSCRDMGGYLTPSCTGGYSYLALSEPSLFSILCAFAPLREMDFINCTAIPLINIWISILCAFAPLREMDFINLYGYTLD